MTCTVAGINKALDRKEHSKWDISTLPVYDAFLPCLRSHYLQSHHELKNLVIQTR